MVSGTLKRITDRIVSHGTDISNVYEFIHFIYKYTKIKLHCITEEEIEAISKIFPGNIPMLKGIRCLYQLITEREWGFLHYRDLNCFCEIENRH